MKSNTLSPELLRKMDAYWRTANYLSVGQIYLYDNPLLKKPLKLEQLKPRLLGHWGTTPGLNFIYVHLNRIIRQYDLNMINVTGSGHGGTGLVANTCLKGTYSEVYPNISQDEQGIKKLFTRFFFPGGFPSHVAPETPGSIHANLHVRGYKENGTTTTPFDMTVLNDLDRFHLAGDVIARVPSLGSRAAYAKQHLRDKLLDHQAHIEWHGEDMSETRDWKWEG